ncbi:MAG TPA: D-alanine--D-alanine ligase [Pirellulales bacterium]
MFHVSTQSGLRVVVLVGGDSPERPVSLASGEQVAAALREAGHTVTMCDPAVVAIEAFPWQEHDACFLALHGGAGEDGHIQERLTALGIPFTGSDANASRLAMCKSASKERFFQVGVPTKPYVLVHQGDSPADVAAKTAGLRFPLIVKPDSQGSSLGLGLARTADELQAAVRAAAKLDDFVMIEPFILGREFTVAMLGRQALPLLEVVTAGCLFDFQAKYESAMTEYRFETGLLPETAAEVEQTAIAAAEAIGTAGLARVDLILDRMARVWVLEVNTIPGMTAHSLAPKAAARTGMNLVALCDWMLEDCLATSEVMR